MACMMDLCVWLPGELGAALSVVVVVTAAPVGVLAGAAVAAVVSRM